MTTEIIMLIAGVFGFMLFIALAALGVIGGRPPIKGSCGGVAGSECYCETQGVAPGTSSQCASETLPQVQRSVPSGSSKP